MKSTLGEGDDQYGLIPFVLSLFRTECQEAQLEF